MRSKPRNSRLRLIVKTDKPTPLSIMNDYLQKLDRTVDEMLDRLSQNIVSVLHGLGYAYTEIDGHLAEIGEALTTQFNGEYEKLGFTLTDFRINGTQFDEQTQARIGRIADVSADA